MGINVFNGIGNIVGKGENAGLDLALDIKHVFNG